METQRGQKRKKDKSTADADKGGKEAKTKQEGAARSQKRERENEQEMHEKAARQQGMPDVSSPGASLSGTTATTLCKVPPVRREAPPENEN